MVQCQEHVRGHFGMKVMLCGGYFVHKTAITHMLSDIFIGHTIGEICVNVTISAATVVVVQQAMPPFYIYHPWLTGICSNLHLVLKCLLKHCIQLNMALQLSLHCFCQWSPLIVAAASLPKWCSGMKPIPIHRCTVNMPSLLHGMTQTL